MANLAIYRSTTGVDGDGLRMRSVAGVIESVWADPDPAEKKGVTAGSAAGVVTRQM
jgi:hypothetical protein